MAEILIKDHENYHLVNKERFIIATTDESILSCTDKQKLSLKNCQAIKNGYDLDELASEFTKEADDIGTKYLGKVLGGNTSTPFKKGFEKCLEINANKKFSKGDVAYIINIMQLHNLSFDEAVTKFETQRQNEWRVEIKMDICGDKVYEVPEYAIDEEECLILTRK